jgi:DNA-directed RNA polymerase subunit RPC12/RpoP
MAFLCDECSHAFMFKSTCSNCGHIKYADAQYKLSDTRCGKCNSLKFGLNKITEIPLTNP